MPQDPPLPPREPSPPSWDQAEEAKKIAESAPGNVEKSTRKKKVRKRVQEQQTPAWEQKSTLPGEHDTDELIERLDKTIQKQGSSGGKKSRRRRRQGVHVREVEYTPGKNFIIATILLAFTGILGAIGYAIYNKNDAEAEADYVSGDLERFMKGEVGSRPAAISETSSPEISSRPPTTTKIDDSRLDPVRACITGFLTANTIEERLQFLRPTSEVRAHMEAMKDHPVMRTQIEPTFGPLALEKEGFVYAEVHEAGVGYRGAILELSEDTALLDFDSFLGYSDVDWPSLESGDETPETEIRALIALLPPSALDDPSRRKALVRDPSESFTVYSTIEIFGIPEQYAALLKKSRQPLPFTVKIQTLHSERTGTSATPEITKVISAGWFKEIDFTIPPAPEKLPSPF